MNDQRRGGWRWIHGGRYARVRAGGNKRLTVTLSGCSTDAEADARAIVLAEVMSDLVKGGRTDWARRFANAIGEAKTAKDVAVVRRAVATLLERGTVAVKAITFQKFAEQWTSGELHQQHPNYVKKKNPKDDIGRLKKHVYPVVGDTPIGAFTRADGQYVLSRLPPTISPASRRHVAQLVNKVLSLAALPAIGIIDVNPLPRGYLPSLGPDKAKPYLYPSEDAKLLACVDVPLERRLTYGVLAREGLRAGELIGNRKTGDEPASWSDVDLEVGVFHLDENKTDQPRAWALDPGVRAALVAWKKLNPEARGGDPIVRRMPRLAASLRADLLTAGVDRSQLFESSASRSHIKGHHLRATFVTLALANGKTETWVQDRTGHTTSDMINKYRRQARTAAELGIGALAPLDEAIPELRATRGAGGAKKVKKATTSRRGKAS